MKENTIAYIVKFHFYIFHKLKNNHLVMIVISRVVEEVNRKHIMVRKREVLSAGPILFSYLGGCYMGRSLL